MEHGLAVRRRTLGAELRALRVRAGLTSGQTARLVGWHQSKLSRIETGRSGVKPSDVLVLLDALGVDDPQVRDLLTAMAGSPDGRAWLHQALREVELSTLSIAATTAGGGVFDVPGQADVVAKVFRFPCPLPEAERLRRLIALPDAMSTDDRDVLRSNSCWPVHTLIDEDGAVVGCLLPKAPDKYLFEHITPSGRTQSGYLEIDWLANPDAVLERRGIPAQDLRARVAVCRDIVAVAAVLENHDLVYSDWSYSNALWCATDQSAYVIDVDGCAPRRSPNVQQPGWEDPLTPSAEVADTFVDRYRLALLVARCLTGRRRPDLVTATLQSDGLPGAADLDGLHGLLEILLLMLLSPERHHRPSAHQLLVEMQAVPAAA